MGKNIILLSDPFDKRKISHDTFIMTSFSFYFSSDIRTFNWEINSWWINYLYLTVNIWIDNHPWQIFLKIPIKSYEAFTNSTQMSLIITKILKKIRCNSKIKFIEKNFFCNHVIFSVTRLTIGSSVDTQWPVRLTWSRGRLCHVDQVA